LAERKGKIIGAMPFAIKRKWGVTTFGLPALTQYLSIWMDKPPDISDHKWLTREKQIIWNLIDELPDHGYFSMVFNEESFNNWLPFHWRGFRQEMRYTFVIDKADASEIDLQINRNLKRNIKEASQSIHIKPVVDSEAFFTLCENTYARQKMPMPYSHDLFRKLDAAIVHHHAGVKLGAYNEQQQIISVAYLLWDQDQAYYFLAGDHEEGRQSGASILICREALRIAFEERQVGIFDFCGSMLESITEIRRQFGARPVPLMKIFKARWKWLDIIYSLTR
jgi:hypothetical protein